MNAPIHKSAGSEVLVWIVSAEGQGEFFSPSWTAFTGRQLADSLDQGWLADVHVDHQPSLLAGIDAAIKSWSNFRQQLRLKRADGEYVWHACEVIVRIDAKGRFVGLIGVCTDITRQLRESIEAELQGRHFIDLLPQTDMIALAVDNTGHTLFFNQALSAALGAPAVELGDHKLLTRFLDRQHRTLAEVLFPEGKRCERIPAHLETEYIEGRDGRHVLFWHSIQLRDYAGQASGLILIGDDQTERRFAEEQLRLTSRVFESADLAMIITDHQGNILSANSAFGKLTGYSPEEAVGKNPRLLQSGRHDQDFYRTMWQTLLTEGHWQGEVWDRRKDGSVYPKFLSINALRNEQGAITHYSGVFYDISERKAVEERLDRLAHFDALTELPNRLFLLDRLTLACHHAAVRQQRFAVMFLDLDRFKQINDTYGHDAGDELLRVTAKRLRDSIRSHDIAARIGGDEFTILLGDIKGPENAALVAQKILDAFAQPIAVAGQELLITPSIGIAICPADAADGESLLRFADQAMYRAKAAGRNNFRFYRGD